MTNENIGQNTGWYFLHKFSFPTWHEKIGRIASFKKVPLKDSNSSGSSSLDSSSSSSSSSFSSVAWKYGVKLNSKRQSILSPTHNLKKIELRLSVRFFQNFYPFAFFVFCFSFFSQIIRNHQILNHYHEKIH